MPSSLHFDSAEASGDETFDEKKGTTTIKSFFHKAEDGLNVNVMTNGMSWDYDFDNSEFLSGFVGESEFDPGCKHVEFILQVLEERIRWSQKREEEKEEFSSSGWRGRKLFLTLRPDQLVKDREIERHIVEKTQIENIRAKFLEFNYIVKIFPSDTRPNSYIIFFPGRTMAQKALVQANTIGYKLVKKRPPRPSPSSPVMFKALEFLKVRSGKALSAEVIDEIKKGDHVIVNQVKGRRARLVSIYNGSNWGWVSVHTVKGAQLLHRCDISPDKVLSILGQNKNDFLPVE